MVTERSRCDLASVSRLGGALRSSAAGLAARAHDLGPESDTGSLAHGVVEQLDAAGSALQAHAQEVAELEAAVDRVARRASTVGLTVEGWRVVEPLGVIRADEARQRLLALPELQHQLDREATRLGRANHRLERVLQGCTQQLALLSGQARDPG